MGLAIDSLSKAFGFVSEDFSKKYIYFLKGSLLTFVVTFFILFFVLFQTTSTEEILNLKPPDTFNFVYSLLYLLVFGIALGVFFKYIRASFENTELPSFLSALSSILPGLLSYFITAVIILHILLVILLFALMILVGILVSIFSYIVGFIFHTAGLPSGGGDISHILFPLVFLFSIGLVSGFGFSAFLGLSLEIFAFDRRDIAANLSLLRDALSNNKLVFVFYGILASIFFGIAEIFKLSGAVLSISSWLTFAVLSLLLSPLIYMFFLSGFYWLWTNTVQSLPTSSKESKEEKKAVKSLKSTRKKEMLKKKK